MSWKKFHLYDGQVTGTEIPGDPSVPETKLYNIHWLRLFGWKKVAVLKIYVGGLYRAPLRLGFRDAQGQAHLNTKPLGFYVNRVRIGREACTFFVLDGDYNEMFLKVVTVTTKDDPAFKKYPLM